MSFRIASLIALCIAGLIGSAQSVEAQNIARRVASAPDGKVRMTYASRPDYCGHGSSISRGSTTRTNWSSDRSEDVEYENDCSRGPVRLVLHTQGGRVTKIRTHVGGRWRQPVGTVTDLGHVSAREATDFLLGLAATYETRVAREAIHPATMADSVVIWPALLRIARDNDRPRETQKQAVFWLGQAAGEKLTVHLTGEDDVDTQIREQAVFALSQRRNAEAVPALLQVARTNRSPKVRKSALFWLGQTADPRAISLFEEILTRR
ncbi:MAG TPA: HEAT repeat domain-containing protein [Gemmatimonadaceae bacterium]|nr:HEAT repeat domain-containing protein [Gemmatimonadaceae bacterium]